MWEYATSMGAAPVTKALYAKQSYRPRCRKRALAFAGFVVNSINNLLSEGQLDFEAIQLAVILEIGDGGSVLFAAILRIGHFPMIAGHENQMDDYRCVFQVRACLHKENVV